MAGTGRQWWTLGDKKSNVSIFPKQHQMSHNDSKRHEMFQNVGFDAPIGYSGTAVVIPEF